MGIVNLFCSQVDILALSECNLSVPFVYLELTYLIFSVITVSDLAISIMLIMFSIRGGITVLFISFIKVSHYHLYPVPVPSSLFV